MQILLTLSIALFAGLMLSRLAKVLKLPAVTAYLVAGILIGPFLFGSLFIPGAEDGLLPFRGVDALLGKENVDFVPPSVDEEERLLYVGITRASEAVFLSS